ncbi:MAG TPA: hypothetical protein VHK67_04015 [Rhabdochlamydiaceae bacterium]|nr:hypothetical protein [Rhabdochlamydiaceae bacterium]
MCPHHCGEWGSDSVHSLEWQFVQGLYDADKRHNYMMENYFGLSKHPIDIQPLIPSFINRPVDFQSDWYQQHLLAAKNAIVVTNSFEGYD